jgi:hypothetical protein
MSDDREIQLEAEKHGVFLTTMQRFYNWDGDPRSGPCRLVWHAALSR